MVTFMTVVMVVVVPMGGVAALLIVAGRVERAREARVRRQVDVTDAIHRELGPVVAPVVKRRRGRGWRVEIAVPFESPTIVGRVGAIAHAVMRDGRPGDAIEVVLTSRQGEVRALDARERARTATVAPAADREEVTAWTGTTMSRAS